MLTFDVNDLLGVLPTLLLGLGGIVVALTEAFLGGGHGPAATLPQTTVQVGEAAPAVGPRRRGYQAWLAIAFAAAALFASLDMMGEPTRALFRGAAQLDGFGAFVNAVIAGTTAFTVLAARGWLAEHNVERGEF